jgi:hypothetical protein
MIEYFSLIQEIKAAKWELKSVVTATSAKVCPLLHPSTEQKLLGGNGLPFQA